MMQREVSAILKECNVVVLFRIGTSRRRDLTETEKTPGPGHYLTLDQL
jgi:hypothetical protein